MEASTGTGGNPEKRKAWMAWREREKERSFWTAGSMDIGEKKDQWMGVWTLRVGGS